MAKKDLGIKILIEGKDQTSQVLSAVQKNLDSLKKALDENTASLKSHKKASEEVKKPLQENTSLIHLFSEALGAAQSNITKTTFLINSLTAAGAKIGALGAAIGALAVFPIKEAAEFERGMSRVRAVTKATEGELTDLAHQAQEVDSKFGAVEAAGVLYELAKAGLNAKEQMAALKPVLDAAVVGEMQVADNAKIAAIAMRAFALPAKDINHVLDVFANIMSSSVADIQELSQSFKYVALEARAFGLSIDEVLGILGGLANAGKLSTISGTAMRSMFTSLATPTSRASAVLDKLGVSVLRNSDGTLAFIETLEALGKALVTPEQLFEIFGKRAYGAAAGIISQIESIKGLIVENKKLRGTVKAMADVMQNNLFGAIEKLNAAFKDLKVAIGSAPLKDLTELADSVTYFVKGLGDIAREHPEAVSAFIKITGGIGLLTTSLVAVGIPLSILVLGLKAMFDLMQLPAVAAFAAAILKWAVNFGIFTSVVEGFIALLAGATATQMFGFVAVTMAATAAIYKAIEAFRQWQAVIVDDIGVTDEMEKHVISLRKELSKEDWQQGLKGYVELQELSLAEAKKEEERLRKKITYYIELIRWQERLGHNVDKEVAALGKYHEAFRLLKQRINELEDEVSVEVDMGKVPGVIKEAQEAMDTFGRSIDDAAAKFVAYGNKVNEWNNKVLASTVSTEDTILNLKRQSSQIQLELAGKNKLAEIAVYQYLVGMATMNYDSAKESARKVKDTFNDATKFAGTALTSMKNQYQSLASMIKKSYEEAYKEAEKYAQKVIDLNSDLENSRKTLSEYTRDIDRKNMSELLVWKDKEAEAERKLAAIKKLFRRGDEESLNKAKELIQEGARIAADLASEVRREDDTIYKSLEQASAIAKSLLEEFSKYDEKVYGSLIDMANSTSDSFYKKAHDMKAALGELTIDRDIFLKLQLTNLEKVQKELDALVKSKLVEIDIDFSTLGQGKAKGGQVTKMAGGGRLPGESLYDTIPVLARPGEWFIRNEAAHFWSKFAGSGFMDGINEPWSQAGEKIRSALSSLKGLNLGRRVNTSLTGFSSGGRVLPDLSNISSLLSRVKTLTSMNSPVVNMGQLNIGVAGQSYKVMGDLNTLSQLKNALQRENLVRSN